MTQLSFSQYVLSVADREYIDARNKYRCAPHGQRNHARKAYVWATAAKLKIETKLKGELA